MCSPALPIVWESPTGMNLSIRSSSWIGTAGTSPGDVRLHTWVRRRNAAYGGVNMRPGWQA
ncbi:hypothetical protein SAV14893_032700 [Streptomyces avermitilis]|uniref:Uncharacterized protein n=1 Tax=Streptomyces avermitilis TaxID=33903 RepID=A0A4D4LZF4_STRAX|nr:hypothetical protein SAV14893_032700 [Streptomyces avermitilis]GDY75979.1 hypothetical protein SAV31267_054640 [Streptomyces avermitilis]GDY84941.1 hypothetical protein SAVCW2_41400 [Streptomyces avermitilis]